MRVEAGEFGLGVDAFGHNLPLFGRVVPVKVQLYGFYDYGQNWEN